MKIEIKAISKEDFEKQYNEKYNMSPPYEIEVHVDCSDELWRELTKGTPPIMWNTSLVFGSGISANYEDFKLRSTYVEKYGQLIRKN